MKRTIIRVSMAIAMSLSLSTAYSSGIEQIEYTPTQGRNLFKTALVGLGLMTMAKPVEAQSFSPVDVKGFGYCYLGTIDVNNTKNMSHIVINSIKDAPCNFYYDYPSDAFRNVSMTISTTCIPDTKGRIYADAKGWPDSPIYHCLRININKINMCSEKYNVSHDGELKWNYKNNNQYQYFSLYLYNNPGYKMYVSDIDGRPQASLIDGNNYVFDKTFEAYMNTGNCPTSAPTDPTRRPTYNGIPPMGPTPSDPFASPLAVVRPA